MSEQLVATRHQFPELVKDVTSSRSALDHQFRKYLDGIGNCFYRKFECGQYFGDKGQEYQISRQPNLLPKAKSAYMDDQDAKRENVVVPLVEALEAGI